MLRVSPTTRPRCSSIVMAILLCRRICRATRGWMSRAVRNDPHDLRVRAQLKLLSHVQLRVVEADLLPGEPEQLALEDLCPADAAVELREGGQLVRRAVPCGKRQAGLDPAFTGMLTVGVLPLLQSLSAATQGQGEEAELLILRSWQGRHRSWRRPAGPAGRHATPRSPAPRTAASSIAR
jgi:hypothetical protein